jgi:hypothetical protein
MSVFSVPERTRISVDRFLKMAETAVLNEDDRVELIDGDIVNMAPIGPVGAPTLHGSPRGGLYFR